MVSVSSVYLNLWILILMKSFGSDVPVHLKSFEYPTYYLAPATRGKHGGIRRQQSAILIIERGETIPATKSFYDFIPPRLLIYPDKMPRKTCKRRNSLHIECRRPETLGTRWDSWSMLALDSHVWTCCVSEKGNLVILKECFQSYSSVGPGWERAFGFCYVFWHL